MTTYRYKGQTPEGSKVSGVIRAYDEYDAVSKLRDTQAIPLLTTARINSSLVRR